MKLIGCIVLGARIAIAEVTSRGVGVCTAVAMTVIVLRQGRAVYFYEKDNRESANSAAGLGPSTEPDSVSECPSRIDRHN